MTRRGWIVLAVLVLAAVLTTATVRQLVLGARAIGDADAALERGDAVAATVSAREAAEAVVPGSPYPARGYERLEAIAKAAEQRGDARVALAGWQAMRAAALATRAPGVATDRWRAMAEDGIVRAGRMPETPPHPVASGAPPAPAPTEPPRGEVHASEEAILDAMRAHEPPPLVGFAMLALGGAAFFGGLARLAWVAGTEQAARARMRWPAVVAVFGLAVYAIACLTA